MSVPVGDELVMMDVDTGKYYAFNDIAAAIWQRLETAVTVEDLCACLQEVFDVPPEQCMTEVLEFLRGLQTRGLVHVVE